LEKIFQGTVPEGPVKKVYLVPSVEEIEFIQDNNAVKYIVSELDCHHYFIKIKQRGVFHEQCQIED